MFLIIIAGCARLDDNLFEPESVSSYQLDDFQGERELTVPEEYALDASTISVLELNSGNTNKPSIIAAIFVGDTANFADPSHKVILYCHGNKNHLDFYWNRIKLLANASGKNYYSVLAVDYRGYGLSKGKPSEKGLYEDVDAAMQWLQQQGLQDDQLIIYGYSLGTAPAVELAVNPRSMTPQKVILEAPFASSAVMTQDASLLSMPSSFVTNIKINNADKIRNMTQALLWLHGEEDDFLSINTHGELVFENHPGQENISKFAVRVAGAKHNNVPQVIAEQSTGFEVYLNRLVDFIEN